MYFPFYYLLGFSHLSICCTHISPLIVIFILFLFYFFVNYWNWVLPVPTQQNMILSSLPNTQQLRLIQISLLCRYHWKEGIGIQISLLCRYHWKEGIWCDRRPKRQGEWREGYFMDNSIVQNIYRYK
jgi:hypothetical protein